MLSRKRYAVTVHAVATGESTTPLYLAPPPATDAGIGLLLAGIAMLRESKNEKHRAWVAEARKVLRIVL
jgi:hypothetical protein